MPVRDPKEVFVTLLSDVRQNTERTAKFYKEIGQIAEDSEIKEALEARAFISENTLEKLDSIERRTLSRNHRPSHSNRHQYPHSHAAVVSRIRFVSVVELQNIPPFQSEQEARKTFMGTALSSVWRRSWQGRRSVRYSKLPQRRLARADKT